MAQRRVPVERMRSSTALQTVAAPVETYVRPAEPQTQESALGAFVRAIAPSIETLADVERQKQLKLQREAEKGIASARALDARLGLGQAERQLNEDYNNNTEFYLNATEEEIVQRRQEITAPIIQKVQDSGDDLLVTALQGDLEVSNLKFFGETLDPAKQEQNRNKILSDLGTEIFAISSSVDRSNPEAMATAVQQIDDLVNIAQKATGLPYPAINTSIYNNFYLPSASSEGRSALYAWLDSKNIPTTGANLPQLGTLKSRLKAYDDAVADQNAVGQYQAILQQNVSTYIANQGANYDDFQIGEQVTLANGTTKKIQKSDVEDALWLNYLTQWDSYQQSLQQLPPSARSGIEKVSLNEAYNTFAKAGMMPPPMRNNLLSGASTLTSAENLTDPVVAERAVTALTAYIQADKYGISIPDNVLNSEQKQRFMVADVLLNDVGLDQKTSLISAANADLSLLNVRINEASALKLLNTAKFSEDLSDVSNIQGMRVRVKNIAGVLLSTDQMTVEEAVNKAISIVEKDTKIISGSNGTRVGIELLNTGITRQGGEEEKIEENLLIASEYRSVKQMMGYFGGTGLSVSNSTNDNLLTLSIVDSDGGVTQTLGYVKLEDFATKDRFINLLLGIEQDLIESGTYDPEAPATLTVDVPAPVLSMGTQLQSLSPELMQIVKSKFPDGSAMSEMLGAMQKGETVVFEPPIGSIPDEMRVETITPLTNINNEETPFFLYAGTMPNGEPMFIKSLMTPEKFQDMYEGVEIQVTEPIPSDVGTPEPPAPTFNDIQQGNVTTFQDQTRPPPRPAQNSVIDTNQITPSDATSGKPIESITSMQGDTTEEKAVNLLIEHEGFNSTPYPDGNDRSVGYGFYLPALEPDEKALIKDINNVTREEANAVLKLKVNKIQNFLRSELPEFEKMSGETQSSVISMAYQLGAENIKTKFSTFFKNLKLATEATQGSFEQAAYLKKAADNMLYNFDEEGNIKSKTLWHQQTPNRANAMAQGLIMQNQQAEGLQAVADVANEGFDALRERALAAQKNKSIEQVPMSEQTNQIGKSVEDVAAVDNARFEEIRQNALDYAERNPDSVIDMLDKVIADEVNEIIPSHFKAFVQDIFKVDLDTARTEDFFRDVEKSAMKDVVLASIKRTGNATSGTVTYGDYDKGLSDVTWGANTDPLSLTDAQGAVKKTLGQFSWRINENGDLIITDQYNFNDAQKYRKQYPTEAAKIKHLMGLGLGVVSGDISTYGWLRRVGALYGSEEDKGAKFEINLGKIN